jgi:hypothetical protein
MKTSSNSWRLIKECFNKSKIFGGKFFYCNLDCFFEVGKFRKVFIKDN